jgi:CRP-like cAMP-binding protein
VTSKDDMTTVMEAGFDTRPDSPRSARLRGKMDASARPLRCQSCRLGTASEPEECPFYELRKPEGAVLVQQDERSSVVWYLRRGRVVLARLGESGSELACSVRGPDSLLAVEALVGEPVRYQISALTDVVLCAIDVEAFRAWVGELCTPMGAVLSLVLSEHREHVTERQGVEGTAVRRVARYLLKREAENGDARATPHNVLSHVLGMRPETLSRALARLRKAQVIAPGRGVRVLDRERLRHFAGE